MRSVALIAVLLLSLLAGCAGDEAAPVDDDEQIFEDFDDDIAADKGQIRGVVVDATITPIADAVVTIRNTELSMTTNQDGAFLFSDLEPGAYFLEIQKTGYTPIQTSTQVTAGEVPDILRVQLEADPQSLPVANTVSQNGYTGCSFLFGITSLRWACDDIDSPEMVRVDTGMETPPDAIQAEMRWEATQLLGNEMRMFVRNGNGPDETINRDYIGLISGASPLTCYAKLGASCSDDTGLSNDTWTGWVHIDGAAGCANGCVPTPLGGAGLGVMVGQHYEAFFTTFVNMLPDEGWTFIADGAHPERQ